MPMKSNRINWSIIISAILLILPVVLILIFDHAAWKSKSNLISDILGTVFFVDVPIAMCLWHWFIPKHFRENRWMIPFGLMTLFSWAVMAGGMWIGRRIGRVPENGFSIFCAYAFGWTYIWMTMIPIGAVYVGFRAILELIELCRKGKI